MKIAEFFNGKKSQKFIVLAGVAGLCLIMISSVIKDPQKPKAKTESPVKNADLAVTQSDFCKETEEKIASFLANVEGVGNVEVMVTVSGGEEYVYATEGKRVKSDGKTEEANQHVMVGSSSNREALIETVKKPEISGIVIACTGSGNPSVQESIYKTVSTAFGISTSRIYVTKLRNCQ